MKLWKRFTAWVGKTKVAIQHWLIKRLGGYTTQYQDNRRMVIQQPQTIHVRKIVKETKVALVDVLNAQGGPATIDYMGYAKHLVAHQVLEDIERQGILFESRETICPAGEIVIRATCYIIPPEEAAKTFHQFPIAWS